MERWRFDIIIDIMPRDKHALIAAMRDNPRGVRFADLRWLCEALFGPPRQRGTSHLVFRMPWAGDPRVNIQAKGNLAKPYQVRQVLAAWDRLEAERDAAGKGEG